MVLLNSSGPSRAGELANSAKRQKYSFSTGGCTISLITRQLPSYSGKPLEFYDGTERLHPVSDRLRRFVGAANLVGITASDSRGRPCNLRLRERTTVEKQRADLPKRPPFDSTIRLVNGRGADVQVFGFDLAGLSEEQHAQAREKFLGAVEIVNQELFLNDEAQPFALLTWRRSDRDIVIIRAEAVPAFGNRARQPR